MANAIGKIIVHTIIIDDFDGLDDIYHSTLANEMRVKADLHNIDLSNLTVVLYLIDTTTYHCAFWPHTAKRFTAFKSLLRSMKDFPKDPGFKEVKRAVNDSIDEILSNKWKKDLPGGRSQVKNLKQVIKILEKLERECK